MVAILRSIKHQITQARKKRKFLRFYGKFVKRGALCFDIGANVGERTEIFLALNAKVVAVEPVAESVAVLQQKFSHSKDVTILPCAVGSEPGKEPIHIANYSEVCTLSEQFIEKYKNQKEHDIRWEETRTVPVETLDHLIATHGVPAFCKIDVEGYEVEVLKGLFQPLPLIEFEYNARLKNKALECLAILDKLGDFTYNFSAYEHMKFSLDSWTNKEAFYAFIENLPAEVKTGDIYVRK